ncbi:MAG TPA: hypothetical protein VFQ97_00090 [Gallionella sp.]|nr:hypothetical protein [Gallionella sp.]
MARPPTILCHSTFTGTASAIISLISLAQDADRLGKKAEKYGKAETEFQHTAIASKKNSGVKSKEMECKHNTDYKNAFKKCVPFADSIGNACVAMVNSKYDK